MDLFRVTIRPLSAWTTPWQADTLWGLLCWACARTDGGDVLRRDLIEPALAGDPPFVVSDAFPSGWLPIPLTLKTAAALRHYRSGNNGDAGTTAKNIRKARWISAAGFKEFQQGHWPAPREFAERNLIRGVYETHNQIGRMSGTTSDTGNMFTRDAWQLKEPLGSLDVHARCKPEFKDKLLSLFKELSQSGFGADVSNGKGEFECVSDLEPLKSEFSIPGDAQACVSLSTFQPSSRDPSGGAWEVFVKYGKFGPDFGLENVFKRPLMLIRPGAVFDRFAPWIGRAIPLRELASQETVAKMEQADCQLIHPAFGLALPIACLPSDA